MSSYDYLIANDDEHEEVFAEIYYEGKFVAIINQEKGLDALEIEFPGVNLVESLIERKLPLTGFLQLVEGAVKILKEK